MSRCTCYQPFATKRLNFKAEDVSKDWLKLEAGRSKRTKAKGCVNANISHYTERIPR